MPLLRPGRHQHRLLEALANAAAQAGAISSSSALSAGAHHHHVAGDGLGAWAAAAGAGGAAGSGKQHLHTGAAAWSGWENFHRVRRRPVPKARVINIDNWQAWKASGLDMEMAAQLLVQLEGPSRALGLDGEGEDPDGTGAVRALLRSAQSLEDVQLVVDHLGEALTPAAAVSLCLRAVTLMDEVVAAGGSGAGAGGWSHPEALRQQAGGLVGCVRPLLGAAGALPRLPTCDLVALMYCAARTQPWGAPAALSQAIAQELLSGPRAQQLDTLAPHTLTSALLSAARLRWRRQEAGAWGALCGAVGRRLPALSPRQLSELLAALTIAGAMQSEPALWGAAVAQLGARGEEWFATDPLAIASAVFAIARRAPTAPSAASSAAASDASSPLAPSSGAASQAMPALASLDLAPLADAVSRAAGGSRRPGALQALAPKAMAQLAYGLAVLGGAQGRGGDQTGAEVAAALRRVFAVACDRVLSFPLTDLALLLEAHEAAVAGAGGGGGGGGDPRLLGLATGVLQARGLLTPASLAPSLHLLALLRRAQPAKPGARGAHLTLVLTDRALGLLRALPAADITRLMAAWAEQDDSLGAGGRLLPAAAQQLLQLVGLASEMRAAAGRGEGGAGGRLPAQWAGLLLDALRSVCHLAARCEAAAGGAVAAHPATQLHAAGRQLADALATCPNLAAQVDACALRRVRATAADSAWLQGHPLLASLHERKEGL